MYCKKCGAQNNDEAVFCRGCGEPIVREQAEQFAGEVANDAEQYVNDAEQFVDENVGKAEQYATEQVQQAETGTASFIDKIKGLGKEKLIGLGVAALAALALLIVLISIIATPAWKRVTKGYIKSVATANYTKAVKYWPAAYLKEQKADDDDFTDKLKEMSDEAKEYLKDYNIKFKSVEPLRYKTVERDKIERWEKTYDLKITAAREVTYRLTMSRDGDKDTEKDTLYLIKVNGKWCVLPSSFGY